MTPNFEQCCFFTLLREAQIMSYFALIMGVSPSKAPVDLLYCPTSALVARYVNPAAI
jgi:hypothetical protein